MMPINFGNYPDAEHVKIQPKSQDYLIKIQYFCNFSLALLASIRVHVEVPDGQGRARGVGAAPRRLLPVGTAPRRLFSVSFVQALHPSRKQTNAQALQTSSKTTLESMQPQNFKTLQKQLTTVWKLCRLCKSSRRCRLDFKIQPKYPEFLLDMRYFCNFSLVSLSIRPPSRRCAERTRQGEGRWSRSPKPALE